MDDDAFINEMVEIIFAKKSTTHEKIVVHSSIYTSLPTGDFPKGLADVLYFRKLIISRRSPELFDGQSRELLSSHEKYVTRVMFSCLNEHQCIQNICESFISVCALVIYFSEETLSKTGVNFRDLDSDIFRVFYRYFILKESFCRRIFMEYICGHKYLTWNFTRDDSILNDISKTVFIEQVLNDEVEEELRRRLPIQKELAGMLSLNMEIASSLAEVVLLTTSVELPALPSEPELIMRLVASRKKEMAEKAKTKRSVGAASAMETSHADTCSISDSKTNYIENQQDDITRHENIIQSVFRHNHSENTCHENANSEIQEETEGVLSHLENTIKSLVEVLDKYNNE